MNWYTFHFKSISVGSNFYSKVYEQVKCEKKYMNRYHFRYSKYMNGSCFSLSLIYEWVGVKGLQPHVRTQNQSQVTSPPGYSHVLFSLIDIYLYRKYRLALLILYH